MWVKVQIEEQYLCYQSTIFQHPIKLDRYYYTLFSPITKNQNFIPYIFNQIKKNDFTEFDFIFGMDDENIEDLTSKATSQSKAKIDLLGNHDPEGERIIRDPYYVSMVNVYATNAF